MLLISPLGLLSRPARATTVVPMTLATIADHAGQVILADITVVRSAWADNPRRIETTITLSPVEYLKGAPGTASASTFTLIVPGGTVGDTQMRITGAPDFRVGDRWMLCLLPTYKTHPVVGVSRGAFKIVSDDRGVQRV
ncbi:MAG: hypothetical protein ACE5EX_12070, partial [Phycisphaerae bacterium]